ncbi:hypothetical protein F4820DRAFT_467584 [Hypoxylon rubiginosum]|uniref:Uncharacterized protein n=1 Tax=Hypoxylon rubiginosum TaxID=110542 RepID=A0ACB9YJ18_9PEZI|nr:hypothetical protein F4820DRAFT_467584 [Hypoxylon rubiginosum]
MKAAARVHLLMLVMGIASTIASPLQPAVSGAVGFAEPNELLPRLEVELSLDCNQLLDQLIGKMEEYAEYSARVLAIATKSGTYGGLAYAVCRSFDQQVINCNYAGLSVASAITVAIEEGFVEAPNLSQGAQAAEGIKPSLDARANTLATRVEAYLRNEDINFDAIYPVSGLGRRSGDEDNGEVVYVQGVKDTTGLTTDLRIGAREHGEGYIHVTSGTGPLGTRATNAGYKVAWKVFNRVDSIPNNAAKGFGKIIAGDWQKRIVDNHNVVDYISRVILGRKGYMDIRIIPETKGFGLGYEDVHDCVD